MKFRDKVTGEVIDVGDAKNEEAGWQQLEFQVGAEKDGVPLQTYKLRDKQTGETISIRAHSQDEAFRIIEEDRHTEVPKHHYGLMEAVFAAPSHALQSGEKTIRETVQPFLHPVEAAENFKNLTYGILQMTGMKEGDEYLPYAQQAGKFLDNRYGSWDAVKRTLAEDPIGLLADLSIVMGGASTAVRAAGMGGKLTRAATTISRELQPASMVARAVQAPGAAARGVVEAGRRVASGPVHQQMMQRVGQAARQYPALTRAAAHVGQHALGKPLAQGIGFGAATMGVPYLSQGVGALAGTAMTYWPITALAVFGYSRAAQRIANKAAKTAGAVSKPAYAVSRTPQEAGGPEGGQIIERKGKGDRPAAEPTRITVRPEQAQGLPPVNLPTYGESSGVR